LIPFTKAHACGNDFLIVTEEAAADHDWVNLTRSLCARNTGIGADGIEFFAFTGPNSGRIRLHNADGSVAEISGNGTRCVAAYMARELGCKPGDTLEIATDAGVRVCQINAINSTAGFTVGVTTGMGIPAFEPKTVTLTEAFAAPFAAPRGFDKFKRAKPYEDPVVQGMAVSTGNPHFVIVVDNPDFTVEAKSWTAIGAETCIHPDFPHQTNVEFLRVLNPNEIEIRIFERGVGPTTSSGTGSSASATAAIALGLANSPLTVVAPGGPQTVTWAGPGTELYLTGPAALICRGEAFYK
jgi:diaminopimelate epimerase